MLDSRNEGRTVFLTGKMHVKDPVYDNVTDFKPGLPYLSREVQYYQMTETKTPIERKDAHGNVISRVNKIEYKKKWESRFINS